MITNSLSYLSTQSLQKDVGVCHASSFETVRSPT